LRRSSSSWCRCSSSKRSRLSLGLPRALSCDGVGTAPLKEISRFLRMESRQEALHPAHTQGGRGPVSGGRRSTHGDRFHRTRPTVPPRLTSRQPGAYPSPDPVQGSPRAVRAHVDERRTLMQHLRVANYKITKGTFTEIADA